MLPHLSADLVRSTVMGNLARFLDWSSLLSLDEPPKYGGWIGLIEAR